MYRVIIHNGINDVNGTVIHSPYVSGQKLSAGSIKQVIDGIDSMSFEINLRNAGWGVIKPLTTLIKVVNVKTGIVEFDGRILKPKQSMSSGGNFAMQYDCESVLAYLLDSSQRHGEYRNMTIAQFLQVILNNHNAQVESHKRFKLGQVTVTNSTDNVYRYLGYENTYDTIKDKLLNRLGGYLVVRRESDGLYLDYLAEIGKTSATEIKLRRNLKDMSREIDPTEVVTRLVPLGAEIQSEDETATDASKARVNIKSVNNNLDYLDDTRLIAEFGIVEKSVVFNDVNQPNILKTRGQQYLTAQKTARNSFDLTFLDLSLNNLDPESVNRGDKYNVYNPIFGINETLQVIQKEINIVNPLDVKANFGDKFKTLTQYQNELNKGMSRYEDLEKSVSNQIQTIGALKTQIDNVSQSVADINTEINESDIPGLVEAIADLNDVVDQLNIAIGNIPNYTPATQTKDGLMSSIDKTKLDGIQLATGTVDGLLAKKDKQKLNRITANTSIDLDQFMLDFLALKEVVENMQPQE